MEVRNRKLTLGELQEQRKSVLASWPTGSQVDLEEGIGYSKSLPRQKVLANLLADAAQEGRTLLNGHGGRALIEEHIQLLKAQLEAGMDYVPTGVDSHTRNNRYQDAENGVAESRKAGRSLLNGFPVAYYGVEGCRRVVEAVDSAVIVRTSALDNQLVAEITLASGFTCFVGGAMSGFAVYSNRAPLSQAIRNYQYVNRLVGCYEESGAPVVREFVMYDMGGGGWPPSIEIVMCVVEALLTAEQGVRHMLIHRYFQGHVLQTAADLRVTHKLVKEYLEKSGHAGVSVYESLVTWPGAFPRDEAQAWAAVVSHAAVATLCGFRVHNAAKTVEEAHGLPSIAASVSAVRACRYVFNMLRGQSYPHSRELQLEMDVQEREARLILDRIFDMGDGDVAVGTERAFESGVMDLPYSPNRGVRSKVIPARDRSGAVRFLEFGDLPFTPDVKEYHRARLAERGRAEGREPGPEMVIDDVLGSLSRVPAKPTRD